MAIVVVNEMQGADQSVYDTLSSRVMPGGQLPGGCQLHIAGPTDGGWRVITVWDSEQQFQEFRDGTLIPAIQDSGFGDRVAPNVQTQPVHKLIT
jgi:heme-degrading monooxygenase HmoA